ncbi:MAG: hypothetical protein WC490_07535 [Candidatus Margulisiibacteriota bacterium]
MGFDRIEIGLGRVARMYQLKPEIMGGKGIIQMRPGIDPAAVLGQR